MTVLTAAVPAGIWAEWFAADSPSPAAAPSSDQAAGWASALAISGVVLLMIILVLVGVPLARRFGGRRVPGGDQADHGPGTPLSDPSEATAADRHGP